jgi:hypothetical protein
VTAERVAVVEPRAWPLTAVDQITAVKSSLTQAAGSVQDVLGRFKGSRRDLVTKHVEILALMGEIRLTEDGAYHSVSIQ